jgi:hypothetical protein
MNNTNVLDIKKRLKKLKKEKDFSEKFEVRDMREKFFMVDDAYLNGWARLFGARTSMVYLCLCRHVGADQACYPSTRLMADKLAMSERQVARAVKLLELHCLIKVSRAKGQPNIYTLLDKKHWKKIIRLAKPKGE